LKSIGCRELPPSCALYRILWVRGPPRVPVPLRHRNGSAVSRCLPARAVAPRVGLQLGILFLRSSSRSDVFSGKACVGLGGLVDSYPFRYRVAIWLTWFQCVILPFGAFLRCRWRRGCESLPFPGTFFASIRYGPRCLCIFSSSSFRSWNLSSILPYTPFFALRY